MTHVNLKKKEYKDVSKEFLWVVKIIRSIETILQSSFCVSLIKQYSIVFPDKDKEFNDLIEELECRCFELNIPEPFIERKITK